MNCPGGPNWGPEGPAGARVLGTGGRWVGESEPMGVQGVLHTGTWGSGELHNHRGRLGFAPKVTLSNGSVWPVPVCTVTSVQGSGE